MKAALVLARDWRVPAGSLRREVFCGLQEGPGAADAERSSGWGPGAPRDLQAARSRQGSAGRALTLSQELEHGHRGRSKRSAAEGLPLLSAPPSALVCRN